MSYNPSAWPSIDSDTQQDFAAAESLLQHSRSARNHALPNEDGVDTVPQATPYPVVSSASATPLTNSIALDTAPQSQYVRPFPNLDPQETIAGYGLSTEGNLSAEQESRSQHDALKKSQQSTPNASMQMRRSGSIERSPSSKSNVTKKGKSQSNGSGSPMEHLDREVDGETRGRSSKDGIPSWIEMKTKAGKERKRLPLACIACRRKKIRCSGEKPTCRHCQRSRVPCVYKVTTRKAAPRTDYMAMLDRRLKRMEDRVIKIILRDEPSMRPPIPRAVVKAPSTQSVSGKKRGAQEAFGPHVDEWASVKSAPQLQKGKSEDGDINSEGAEHLPSVEIQQHLSETFFDYVYGQSYHLMHKPSYMKKLRAGTLPPVLVLAVCAVSARFSSHPQITGDPEYLRGEEWAAPAREIALRRYDEPKVAVLVALTLLGLHEFGTCQGGRSWMLAGMATRMAYALQLHRELDYDPLGRKTDQKSELSFTDREIRRRAMWACFIMDRFTASGTERPMFADEEAIKIQLPIKESLFRMDIPGPTESLDGQVPDLVPPDNGQFGNAKDNMGVAAYMIRVIALWGRVIKYLNMGGREKDPFAIWEPDSQFADLRQQAENFISSLPDDLQYTKVHLEEHAAERLGNQFIFLHVASNHVLLFLHRYAIPTTPGASNLSDIPKSFLAKAGPAAVDAAAKISMLLEDALDYNAVAPFIGYCAFLSGTVHVWGLFSRNASLEALCKKSLGSNIKYLNAMEKYWGMMPFMVKNLKDMYREHADAASKGIGERSKKDATIFQYGDWFTRYPHGISSPDGKNSTVDIKKELGKAGKSARGSEGSKAKDASQKLSSPPSKSNSSKRSSRKHSKPASSQPKLSAIPPRQQAPSLMLDDPNQHQPNVLPIAVAESNQPPMTPYTPTHPQLSQLYSNTPTSGVYPSTPQDLMPLHTAVNTSLLPQLDRSLVYDAYAGNSNESIDLNALMSQMQGYDQIGAPGGVWEGQGLVMDIAQQQQAMMQGQGSMGVPMGPGPFPVDPQTSAWFMPFNMIPPGLDGNGEDMGRM